MYIKILFRLLFKEKKKNFSYVQVSISPYS